MLKELAASFEIEGQHRRTAEKLTQFYRSAIIAGEGVDLGGAFFGPRARLIAGGVPQHDVRDKVGIFIQDVSFARKTGSKIPMAVIPEIGPVPILNSHRGAEFSREKGWIEAPYGAWPQEEVQYEFHEAATEAFLHALQNFLEYRVAGYAFWRRREAEIRREGYSPAEIVGSKGPPAGALWHGGIASGGGLIVTLSCRNNGLRALSSLSLGIHWEQFGSPTTPVTSVLGPGIYLFAADGGIFGSRKVPDRVPARIPPNLTPCAVAF